MGPFMSSPPMTVMRPFKCLRGHAGDVVPFRPASVPPCQRGEHEIEHYESSRLRMVLIEVGRVASMLPLNATQ